MPDVFVAIAVPFFAGGDRKLPFVVARTSHVRRGARLLAQHVSDTVAQASTSLLGENDARSFADGNEYPIIEVAVDSMRNVRRTKWEVARLIAQRDKKSGRFHFTLEHIRRSA